MESAFKSITLTGEPRSTQTIYGIVCRGNFPSRYMTKLGKAIKEDYGWQARSQWKGKPEKGFLIIYIKLFFGRKGKHDIDNFGKILLDSLSGIVWEDDSQISQMTVTKYYDKENPRIELIVEPI